MKIKIRDAAQKIYDEWIQDENGFNEKVELGGICDLINNEIQIILKAAGFIVSKGEELGTNHVFSYAEKDLELYVINIPSNVYETGAGRKWIKKPNLKFKTDDIVFHNYKRKLNEKK